LNRLIKGKKKIKLILINYQQNQNQIKNKRKFRNIEKKRQIYINIYYKSLNTNIIIYYEKGKTKKYYFY